MDGGGDDDGTNVFLGPSALVKFIPSLVKGGLFTAWNHRLYEH